MEVKSLGPATTLVQALAAAEEALANMVGNVLVLHEFMWVGGGLWHVSTSGVMNGTVEQLSGHRVGISLQPLFGAVTALCIVMLWR